MVFQVAPLCQGVFVFLSPIVIRLNVMAESYFTCNRTSVVSSGCKLSKHVTQTVILFLCLCMYVFALNINTNVDTVSGVRFLVYPTLRRCLNVCSQAKICECVCLEHAESSTQQHCYVMQSCFVSLQSYRSLDWSVLLGLSTTERGKLVEMRKS